MFILRFSCNSLMKRHVESFHIKARHMVCRFEGCDMAYNDFASRCNHEKMKHGDTFPRAVKKGLVPPRSTKDPHLL